MSSSRLVDSSSGADAAASSYRALTDSHHGAAAPMREGGAPSEADKADRDAADVLRAAAKAPFKVSTFVAERLPVLQWLPKYSPSRHLPGDLIAGITVGLMVIPQGLSYATVAGVPPIYGLYSAFIGVFVYAVFGGCKDISVGPTAILSLISFQANHGHVATAIQTTMLSGVFQMMLAVGHLGLFVDFISVPVLSGFTSAAAIQIILTQVGSLCGYKTRSEVYYAFYDIFHDLHKTLYPDLLLGLASMVILVVMSKLKTWFPHSFVMSQLCTGRNAVLVMVSTLLSYLIGLHHKVPWKVVGLVPSGLPSASFPAPTNDMLHEQASGIALSALVGFLETIAIAKAFARQNGYSHKLSSNQELFAVGFANFIGSFFGALPVTGSFSRTAVASQAGAKTQLQGVFTGIVVLLALVLLTPCFAHIPKSVLSAVVMVAASNLVDVGIFRELWNLGFLGRLDFASLVLSFLGCLFLDIQWGILIGIGASLCITLVQMARPRHVVMEALLDGDGAGDATEYEADSTKQGSLITSAKATVAQTNATIPEDMLILRVDASLVFFNIAHISDLFARVELERFAMVPVKVDDILDAPSALEIPLLAVAASDDDDIVAGPPSHAISKPSPFIDGLVDDDISASAVNGGVTEVFVTRHAPAHLRECRMRVLLVDCSSVNVVDTSSVRGLYMLCKEYSTRLHPVSVHFACVKPHVVALLHQALPPKIFPNGLEHHIHRSVAVGVECIARHRRSAAAGATVVQVHPAHTNASNSVELGPAPVHRD